MTGLGHLSSQWQSLGQIQLLSPNLVPYLTGHAISATCYVVWSGQVLWSLVCIMRTVQSSCDQYFSVEHDFLRNSNLMAAGI